MRSNETETSIERHFDNAVEWKLLSLLFMRPTKNWIARLNLAVRETKNAELQVTVKAAKNESFPIDLYETTFSPEGMLSLRESTYNKNISFEHYFTQLPALYEKFDYQPEFSGSPDHLAIELGFVSHLCLKQAFGKILGHHERSKIEGDVSERFIQTHLCSVAMPVAHALQKNSESYLLMAAIILQQRLIKYALNLGSVYASPNADDKCDVSTFAFSSSS
jgi:nitrate reductase assembly molybdenum cofactor insertion protein NarJ